MTAPFPVLAAACSMLSGLAGGVDLLQEFARLHERVAPSIVDVVAFSEFHKRLDRPRLDARSSEIFRRKHVVGAGFFVDGDGGLVTNAHVVADAALVFIKPHASDVLYQVKVHGTEPRHDLAYLISPNIRRPFLRLDRGDPPRVGTWIGIVGNPLGQGTTFSYGMVAAVSRMLLSEKYDDFIQLSASVNPGNSGGPVLSLDGQVVGVLTSKAVGTAVEGVAFAVPSYLVALVVDQLRDKGYFQRVWLGIQVRDRHLDELAQDAEAIEGVVIAEVTEGSPAAVTGLRVGDTLLRLGDRSIASKRELANQLLRAPPFTPLRFFVQRDNQRLSIEVPYNLEDDSFQREEQYVRRLNLGLTLEALSPRLRRKWNLKNNQQGLLVVRLREGRARRLGLRPGDLLTHVGETAVKTVHQVVPLLYACHYRQPSCVVTVVRAGQSRTVAIQ